MSTKHSVPRTAAGVSAPPWLLPSHSHESEHRDRNSMQRTPHLLGPESQHPFNSLVCSGTFAGCPWETQGLKVLGCVIMATPGDTSPPRAESLRLHFDPQTHTGSPQSRSRYNRKTISRTTIRHANTLMGGEGTVTDISWSPTITWQGKGNKLLLEQL